MLVELRFEALEQRERVGGRTGKSREHAVAVEAAHLARGRLDDDAAERHLAVAAERDGAVAANGKNRGSVKGFHVRSDPGGALPARCELDASGPVTVPS